MPGFLIRKSIAALQAEVADPEIQALTRMTGCRSSGACPRSISSALGIGAIIGAGIFVLTGHAAAANAGPAITLSFAARRRRLRLAGLCYAEMASTVPVAGSAYTYAYATLGEFIAWIIGWDLILEYALGATTVAIGWSGYVVSFLKDFGIIVPAGLCQLAACLSMPRSHAWHFTGAVINAPAHGDHCPHDAHCWSSASTNSRAVNNVIVAIKLVIIVLFIVAAAPFVTTAHWVDPAQSRRRFHSAQSRPRRVRLEWRRARRRGRVLRLYRLRRRLDGGAGSQQSAARHANRHSRLAC